MSNAKVLSFTVAVLALGACHKQQPNQVQNMSIDEGVPTNQVAVDNAQIETLPADESSTTPSNQLQNGADNPDVNDLGATNSQ